MIDREIDVLVSVRIFGQAVYDAAWPCGYDPECGEYEASADKESPPSYHDEVGPVINPSGHLAVPVPMYSTTMPEAWKVVERMRDLWTATTEGVRGTANEIPNKPFDDDEFFASLHRSADRRWPWAMLYLTPRSICLAALAAFGVGVPQPASSRRKK